MTPASLGNDLLSIGLTVPRIAAAFMILPLFTGETIPALVRNSFFVALAIVAFPIAAASAPLANMGAAMWPLLVIKELFIGGVLGFLFGSVFWALSAAGTLIDSKVGANFSGVIDPIQGHETSLTGELLSQLAAWLFMASGAFLVFLDLLLSSYALWPVSAFTPELKNAGITLLGGEFARLMTLALLFSAPALVLLSLVDMSLGLVNRYAEQLNVFALALAIKAWVAIWVTLLTLGLIVDIVLRRLFSRQDLLEVLKRLW